jgi:hypothetical protein
MSAISARCPRMIVSASVRSSGRGRPWRGAPRPCGRRPRGGDHLVDERAVEVLRAGEHRGAVHVVHAGGLRVEAERHVPAHVRLERRREQALMDPAHLRDLGRPGRRRSAGRSA